MKKIRNYLSLAILFAACAAQAAYLNINLVSVYDVDLGRGLTRYVTLSVTNTSTNYLYGIYRRVTVNGPETLVGTNFIGNNGTVTLVDVVHADDPSYFYRSKQEDGFIAWNLIGPAVGDQEPCPGPYVGYGNYLSPDTNVPVLRWWLPDTNNYSTFTMTDLTRTDTHISWLTDFGTSGCTSNTAVLTGPWGTNVWGGDIGRKMRFTLYVPSNRPTNAYPMRLIGWLPKPPGGFEPLPQVQQLEAPLVSGMATMSATVQTSAVARKPLTAAQLAERQAQTQALVDQLNAATAAAQAQAAARKANK